MALGIFFEIKAQHIYHVGNEWSFKKIREHTFLIDWITDVVLARGGSSMSLHILSRRPVVQVNKLI